MLLMVVVWSTIALSRQGQWKAFTAKRDVRDLAVAGQILWTATGGGAFSYSLADNSYRQLTTADGLQTNDLTAVAVDSSGDVWFGSSNGIIHRYTPSNGGWQYVTDIAQKQIPNKRINALRVAGDTLFILADNGLGLFSIGRMEFGDTYGGYGSGAGQISGSVVDATVYHGRMWLATRFGIASTSTSNPNPSQPESWLVYNHLQGLPSDVATSLAVFHDTLFAGTTLGLAYFADSLWYTVGPTAGLSIRDLAAVAAPLLMKRGPYDILRGALLCITDNALLTANSSGDVAVSFTGFQSVLSRLSRSATTALGTQGSGIATLTDTVWNYHVPPGPPTNNFVGIAVDNRGAVWSGSGATDGIGFVSFDGSSWRLYSTDTSPELGTNNYYKIDVGANNAKWAMNWGSGVALVDDAGNVKKVYDASNGIPPAIDPAFVVVGGVATAPDGTAWVADRTPPGDTSIILIRPDSSLSYVVGCGPGCSMRNPYNVFTDVVIDQNGTKWFANFSPFEPSVSNRLNGFFYYNDQYSLPGTTNGWGKLTTDDGIPSTHVWSLAVDRDNVLWIGTDEGIALIFDPSNPKGHVAPYYPPPQNQVIQSIAVDPLNNKWVATKQGVFVLSSDGTSILNHYTSENTAGKLLDDDVNSIAIDGRTGTVYFGTERGLCALTTTAVAPTPAMQDLSFSPNPFHVPSQTRVLIDGLAEGSTLKILRVDGALVRELPTPGGRIAYWDGTDKTGHLVSSGVYIVVAYSADGATVVKGKLAVIRK